MSRRVLFVRFDLGGMCTQYLFNRYCYWKGGRQMQRLSGGDERTEGGKVWGGFKKYSYKRGRLYKKRVGRKVLLGPTFGEIASYTPLPPFHTLASMSFEFFQIFPASPPVLGGANQSSLVCCLFKGFFFFTR